MSVSNIDRANFDRKIARAIDLVKSGKSYMYAARTVGLNRNTVTKYCEEKGVASPMAAKLESKVKGKVQPYGQPIDSTSSKSEVDLPYSKSDIDHRKLSVWERIKNWFRIF